MSEWAGLVDKRVVLVHEWEWPPDREREGVEPMNYSTAQVEVGVACWSHDQQEGHCPPHHSNTKENQYNSLRKVNRLTELCESSDWPPVSRQPLLRAAGKSPALTNPLSCRYLTNLAAAKSWATALLIASPCPTNSYPVTLT